MMTKLFAGAACLLLVAAAPPRGAKPQQLLKAGESFNVRLERNARGTESAQRLEHHGSRWIKLHFAHVSIGSGGYIRVVGEDGRVGSEFTESGSDLWALSHDGSAVTIEANNASYHVDRYGAGTTAIDAQQVVLGSDERLDRECFAGETKYHLAEAVGRMLFQESNDGLFYVCTGSVISNLNHFLTNNHCVDNQTEVNSLEVRFNYDRTTCGGSTIKTYDAHSGGTFVRTNAGLDFTLLRLNNHTDGHTAAGRHGYLEVRGQTPSLNELLFLPQHPGGNPKRITDTNCYVNMTNYSEPGYTANSSIQHQCDTEGGSSGSPILNLNNQVIALHHTGYTGSHNGAIRMNVIFPLIEADLPATGAGGHSGSTGWFWYRPQEAWWYTTSDQHRLWVFLQGSGDYLWADAVRESTIAQMMRSAVQSNHYLGVFWTGGATYSNVRVWYN